MAFSFVCKKASRTQICTVYSFKYFCILTLYSVLLCSTMYVVVSNKQQTTPNVVIHRYRFNNFIYFPRLAKFRFEVPKFFDWTTKSAGKSISKKNYIVCCTRTHRRRIKTEEKAQVVANVCQLRTVAAQFCTRTIRRIG